MAIATLIERKSFRNPDETRTFTHGRIDIVNVGGTQVGLARFEPGWKWSKDVKPIAGTASCQAPHLGYIVAGRMHIVGDDGTEADYEPGDAMSVPPGHDAWVVGSEPCIIFDVTAAPVYAKKK